MASSSISIGRLTTDKSGSDNIIFTARPDKRILKVSLIPPGIVILIGVIVSMAHLPLDHDIQLGLSAFVIGVGLVGLLCVAVLYEGLARAVYTVTCNSIEEEYGILYKRVRQIPLSYVRDMTCTQNL